MTVYLCGPMSNVFLFNFPAFDSAAARIRALGHKVISPADMDREVGFDPTGPARPDFLAAAMRRDISSILRSEAVAVLPGWRDSHGTKLEVDVAVAIGIPVLEAETLEPVRAETILEEAARITSGSRPADYAPPGVNHERCARLWSVLFGVDITAEQVCMAMVLFKAARGMHRLTRDTLVDIAGYARNCEQMGAGGR